MPTLIPWTTVEVGNENILAPALPALVVHTWYVDGEAESSVTYFWRDEVTWDVRHELLYIGPAAFTEAVSRAEAEAPKRNVERIHVKHARSTRAPVGKGKSERSAKKVPEPKGEARRKKKKALGSKRKRPS